LLDSPLSANHRCGGGGVDDHSCTYSMWLRETREPNIRLSERWRKHGPWQPTRCWFCSSWQIILYIIVPHTGICRCLFFLVVFYSFYFEPDFWRLNPIRSLVGLSSIGGLLETWTRMKKYSSIMCAFLLNIFLVSISSWVKQRVVTRKWENLVVAPRKDAWNQRLRIQRMFSKIHFSLTILGRAVQINITHLCGVVNLLVFSLWT
jgi:hypothetical protein